MDLKDLTPTSDTVDVNIVHPTTLEPLLNDNSEPMVITMYAPHSKEYKAAVHEQTNKRLKQAQSKKKVDLTAEDIEDATLDLFAKTTKSWNITYDGEEPNFSVSKAKEIYSEVFWIRDQIDEAVSNSLNFKKA
jgi:excinuclease UvrABC helicase subunit UvrB